MPELELTVTELAHFCFRSGDIDQRGGPSPTSAQGIAGHQTLFKSRPTSYRREHPVTLTVPLNDLSVTLRGRADGYDPEEAMVEEIKTCRIEPSLIAPARHTLHLSQAKLYAAIIAATEAHDTLTVRLTWLNIDSNEEHQQSSRHTSDELAGFLSDALNTMSEWLRRIHELRARRAASLARLPFPPGEFRSGQREISELVYKCIDQRGQLLLEAPTGIGKTAAVLYPALKALGQGKHDKIIFATVKTSGRYAAETTLAHFRQAGMTAQALSITAKERICFSPGAACHADDCIFAAGYYDRLPAARSDALQRATLTRQDIESVARAHTVCPYELAKDMQSWVDVLVADVHYLYSPYGMLGNPSGESSHRASVLLDEAHNLPDRARSMYSATLPKSLVMRARREVGGSLRRALDRLNRQILQLHNTAWPEPDFSTASEIPKGLLKALTGLCNTVSEEMAETPALLQQNAALRDLFFCALQILQLQEDWGEEFRFERHRGKTAQSLELKINCLDAARLLAARQVRAHAVVVFSATLSPAPWARDSLGLSQDAVCLRAHSPFQRDQLRVSIDTTLDTRFREREATLARLAATLREWLAATPGNCIVYFPSYHYLEQCAALLRHTVGGRQFWQQEAGQREDERTALLEQLHARDDTIALCILGGLLGEGIDLPGDQLTSVVIVGVGMPQINRATRELQAWYDARGKTGFDYTFLYPGMQKIAQALGRVVRTPSDRGKALLIDPRYAQSTYRNLLPPWWDYRMTEEH